MCLFCNYSGEINHVLMFGNCFSGKVAIIFINLFLQPNRLNF